MNEPFFAKFVSSKIRENNHLKGLMPIKLIELMAIRLQIIPKRFCGKNKNFDR
jgi:hypothetical protein